MKVVALLAALLVAGAAHAEGKRYALVIGANEGDRDDVTLRFARSDAHRVAQVLRDLGGFDGEDVVELDDASASDVRRALIRENALIRQRGADSSLLVVYYSGHADADALHLGGTRLPMSELRDLVTGSPATARVLLLDACRSGVLTRIKGGHAVPEFVVDPGRAVTTQGVAILSSSAANESAQESDEIGASFFTHFLVSGLIGAADTDLDGTVTLAEAFAYAAERTLAATVGTAAGPQHPTYRYELGGREDLVLTRPVAGGRALGTLALSTGGHFLVHRGRSDGAIVADVSADAPRRILLERGTYVVVLRGTDDLRQGTFAVRAGDTTGVDPRTMQRFEYARVVRKGARKAAVVSLFADGGVRGSLVGLGPAWRADMGARVDLHSFSLELVLGVAGSRVQNDAVTDRVYELAPAIVALHAFDLGPVTLGVGGEVGVSWLSQRFVPVEHLEVPARNSAAFEFGLVGQLEVPIRGRFYARVEAALLSYVMRVAESNGSSIAPQLSYRAVAGFGLYL